MNIEKDREREINKDRKTILREERLKGEKSVEVQKTGVENSDNRTEKKKLLREVIVKIGLKQKDNEERIVVEMLLDSNVTRLVMSSEFARKNKFKKKKLDRLIYVRNMDNTFNYEGPIEHIVKVELFYRGHKEKIKIDVIEGQKWSVILGMSWLAHHNSEID